MNGYSPEPSSLKKRKWHDKSLIWPNQKGVFNGLRITRIKMDSYRSVINSKKMKGREMQYLSPTYLYPKIVFCEMIHEFSEHSKRVMSCRNASACLDSEKVKEMGL